MSFKFNPYDMGEEFTNSTPMPEFTKGTFMLLNIAPPKSTPERTKGIRDGLVATLGMLSYEDANKVVIPTVKVEQTVAGYLVEFPQGKRGLLSTKFRGPKNWYSFYNNTTGKKYVVGKNDPVTKINSRCTVEAAEATLSINLPNWSTLTQPEKDLHIDKYFEDFYMFGLAKDFNLEVEENPNVLPTIGMVTDFYREYTPPVGDDKYGRIVVTKFAPKHKVENLTGAFQPGDAEIAAAILEGIKTNTQVNDLWPPLVDNSDGDIPF